MIFSGSGSTSPVLQDVEKDEKLRKLEKERRRIEKEKELYETRQREQAIILRVPTAFLFFYCVIITIRNLKKIEKHKKYI
jgi:hypothetical protein